MLAVLLLVACAVVYIGGDAPNLRQVEQAPAVAPAASAPLQRLRDRLEEVRP